MGNSSSSLPYSIDNQVGAPKDHNGWALHNGKSTDGNQIPVSVFVGKKPLLNKTPMNPKFPSQMQLIPAFHHYNHCRKLRHPQILKVYATLDTDNPSAATSSNEASSTAMTTNTNTATSSNANSSTGGLSTTTTMTATSSTASTTGDLIVVTEPCMPLSQWFTERNPTMEQLAWGLECIVKGLHFLHTSAHLAHGNITPTSLYVTPSGDVKLWNFNLVTPIGPGMGPTIHFQHWEQICTINSYRSPERQSQSWTQMEQTGGGIIHAMDSYSLGVLIADYWYNNHTMHMTNHNNGTRVGGTIKSPPPAVLMKAVQRMQTPNMKMRPRLQPLLKCPVFDTPYQKLQWQLEELAIQPVEQKVLLWQRLGQQLLQSQQQQLQQQQPQLQSSSNGGSSSIILSKDVALFKILPLILQSLKTITNNDSLLGQDMYRREVLAMLSPLFYIEEHYQDPSIISKELAPMVSKLFLVPDRGVRSVLLNQVGFMTKHLDKNALNTSVFDPMCSGFNDSSPALRELTLKATLNLVPFLHSPSVEKLSRYLVRLQADTETSIRTNAVIFIAKIAPHLSEVSKQKMLLPAYARAMRDTFAPCRLSALQSTVHSKSLFTMMDVATKVAPSVMPLTLDPMPEVRKEAFRVIHILLKDLEQESQRLLQEQEQQQQPSTTGPATSTTNGLSVSGKSPAPVSGGSGTGSTSYLSGLSSWMTSSASSATQPSGIMSAMTATSPSKSVNTAAPSLTTTPTTMATTTVPAQQFGAMGITVTSNPVASSTVAADDGWDDDADDDDGWGDDDNDIEVDPFATIGTKTVVSSLRSSITTTAAKSNKKDMDDPFATFGMNPTLPRSAISSSSSVGSSRNPGGNRLVLPKKTTNLPAKKLVAAPPTATKLTMNDDDDITDGWDDF